jgi:hypothetical protein
MDLSKKRIIMIHGLASKPPAKDLHEMWSKCLIENVRLESASIGRALDANRDVLRHAYWANAVPHHIEDDRGYVNKLRGQVDEVIKERQTLKRGFHVGAGPKVKAFFKSRALDVVDVFTSALTIKDDVARTFLREVELYSQDQYISDAIREPLETELRSAWDDGCEVALLSHSMGTFISYDVLWRFAHRNVSGFRPYRNKRVRLLATMGSPLGDPIIRKLLFARHHEKQGKRAYPTNIDYWHNYACLGDVVSHDSTFEDDFFAPMRKEKVLPQTPKHRGIDYKNLHNPFEVVSHSGNKKRSKRNPHKSYGYLVQPRLGSWIRDFLKDDLK